ncbi:MAG: hypothetical protein H7Y20_04565 [Bryobacteraceae bacterium]|nr:hypothetical protein [Bryobacteraceae bacterium]
MRFLTGLFVVAGSLMAADVSGTWQGSLVTLNTKYGVQAKENMSLQLSQNGSVLSGTLTRNKTTWPVSSGSESNGTVNLAFRLARETGSVRLTLNNGKLQGTVSTVAGFSGTVDLSKK